MYVPNNRTSKYMKDKLRELKGGIDKCIIIIRDWNITQWLIEQIERLSVKNMEDLKNALNLNSVNWLKNLLIWLNQHV